jgi:hypothetical protein
VTLASSLNPSLMGDLVTLSATVAGLAPTGTVGFYDGGRAISGCDKQSLREASGAMVATCATSKLTLGTHSITATYSGDRSNTAMTSAPLLQSVTEPVKTATTVTLASSANPSVARVKVTFTATVVGAAPTGAVKFTDDGIVIGGCETAKVEKVGTSYAARCITSALPVGTHAIVASYSGDETNAGSVSEALSQVVQ